jgi:hypothetical protein
MSFVESNQLTVCEEQQLLITKLTKKFNSLEVKINKLSNRFNIILSEHYKNKKERNKTNENLIYLKQINDEINQNIIKLLVFIMLFIYLHLVIAISLYYK